MSTGSSNRQNIFSNRAIVFLQRIISEYRNLFLLAAINLIVSDSAHNCQKLPINSTRWETETFKTSLQLMSQSPQNKRALMAQ